MHDYITFPIKKELSDFFEPSNRYDKFCFATSEMKLSIIFPVKLHDQMYWTTSNKMFVVAVSFLFLTHIE